MCVDQEASIDSMAGVAHTAFNGGNTCNASGQNECPMWGSDIANQLPMCLTQMWGEKDLPQCAGCDSCDFPYTNCTNCTFEGTNGTDGCGHYLNMKSSAFSTVACGFSADGWYAQDFN